MIAMPLYLQKSGSFVGLVFFIVTMLLTYESIRRMSVSKSYDSIHYVDVVERHLGYSWKILSVICISVSTYGSAIAYIQFIQTTMSDFDGIDPMYTVPVLGILVSVSSFFDRLESLSKFSSFGLLFSVSFGVMIVIRSFTKTSSQNSSRFRAEFFETRWDTMPSATGLAVFCNEGIVVMGIQVADKMRRSEDFLSAAAVSVFVFTIAYMSVAFAGSLLYYGNIRDEITQNLLDDLDIPSRVCANLYCIQVVLTFPIVLWMGYTQYESVWMQSSRPPSRKTRIGVRIISVIIVCIVAVTLKGFGDVLALTGSAANSINIYILPNLCYEVAMKSVRRHRHRDRVITVLFILFGVVTGTLGTIQSTKDLIDQNT